jgi:hypothetical protein
MPMLARNGRSEQSNARGDPRRWRSQDVIHLARVVAAVAGAVAAVAGAITAVAQLV